MTNTDILSKIMRLDQSQEHKIEDHRAALHVLGENVLPHMVTAYPRFRKWQGRNALVFHATKFARINNFAFELGYKALQDRSKKVRFQACRLLAYSLNRKALPHLEQQIKKLNVADQQDFKAAITAIENQNHHLFLDRKGTGIRLIINPEDRQ